jgi:hypothetical protein
MLSLRRPTSHSSVLSVPIRCELTAHGSRYIAAEWTYIRGNSRHVITTYCCDVTADIENSFLYYCVLDRVYRAVVWQRVDQIRYSMMIQLS